MSYPIFNNCLRMRQLTGWFNETKHRLMSAKRNLSRVIELQNTDFFYETDMPENNFSSLNLPSSLLDCLMKIFCLVNTRITNLYNFVINSTVW